MREEQAVTIIFGVGHSMGMWTMARFDRTEIEESMEGSQTNLLYEYTN